jgi:hypothetical protein
MGYISLKKFDGTVDLLPADNIMHVAKGAALDIAVIEYGVSAGNAATSLQASIQFAESSNGTTDKDWSSEAALRNALNNAIQLANGNSGPAVPVKLETGMVCESVTIDFA